MKLLNEQKFFVKNAHVQFISSFFSFFFSFSSLSWTLLKFLSKMPMSNSFLLFFSFFFSFSSLSWTLLIFFLFLISWAVGGHVVSFFFFFFSFFFSFLSWTLLFFFFFVFHFFVLINHHFLATVYE